MYSTKLLAGCGGPFIFGQRRIRSEVLGDPCQRLKYVPTVGSVWGAQVQVGSHQVGVGSGCQAGVGSRICCVCVDKCNTPRHEFLIEQWVQHL